MCFVGSRRVHSVFLSTPVIQVSVVFLAPALAQKDVAKGASFDVDSNIVTPQIGVLKLLPDLIGDFEIKGSLPKLSLHLS